MDELRQPKAVERYPDYLPKVAKRHTPAEVRKTAADDDAELLALSGPRNGYPGTLGVAERDALANHVLVDGKVQPGLMGNRIVREDR